MDKNMISIQTYIHTWHEHSTLNFSSTHSHYERQVLSGHNYYMPVNIKECSSKTVKMSEHFQTYTVSQLKPGPNLNQFKYNITQQ